MRIEDLNSLKIIHVSGTKGKGSTCAFCESILRHSGLKTGFFSSPHLVSVTERIKINGRPVDQEMFTSYFWDIYNKVCKDRDEDDRPPYFKFLTLLAFNIFWKEKVDVAIIEVGIGGQYDCTNIIEKPTVTGITSLGLDHTSILGTEITDIAWHKAGIMKKDVVNFVDPHQKSEAIDVIWQRAGEIGSQTLFAPALDEYKWPAGQPPKLGLYGEVQQHNASLALALSSHFLSVHGDTAGDSDVVRKQVVRDSVVVRKEVVRGLEQTVWPGRNQTMTRDSTVFYLDGAHTEESICSCVDWFSSVSSKSGSVFRVLIFNTTGDREVRCLLTPLSSLDFDLVIFCTNTSSCSDSADQQNYNSNYKIQLSRCDLHDKTWRDLMMEQRKSQTPASVIIPCYNDAISWISKHHCDNLPASSCQHSLPDKVTQSERLEILVTGSLHLIGGVLGFMS